tara:strand:- start:14082 stop:14909 length:828 start_codon:yes stop_codon:yes gene_type:complete
MRITKRQLTGLIQAVLSEAGWSRGAKVDFGKQIRDNHPELNRAYYTHWIRTNDAPMFDSNRKVTGYIGFRELLVSKLKWFMNSHREISVSLADPSGRNISSFRNAYGDIGIVMQGVVTYAGGGDTGSSNEDTPSGKRLFATFIPEDDDETDESYGTHYNAIRHLGSDAGSRIGEKDLFINPIDGFRYSSQEFNIVPKKIIGLLLHTSFVRDGTYDPENNRFDIPRVKAKEESFNDEDNKVYASFIEKVGRDFNIPVAIGKDQIREFIVGLYRGNK